MNSMTTVHRRQSHFGGAVAGHLEMSGAPSGFAVADRAVSKTRTYLDIENLLGDDRLLEGALMRSRLSSLSRDLIALDADSFLAIGVGPAFLRRAPFIKEYFPGARILHKRGVDGADHAILEDISRCGLPAEKLVICSGDHIFRDVAIACREHKVEVQVVSRKESLSSALRFVACEITIYEHVDSHEGGAA